MLLAACQIPQQPASQKNAAAQPAPAAPIAAAPKPTPLAVTPAVAHASAPNVPLVHLSGDPQELVGLDHATVRRTLGDPVRIRSELPAQVWQYATGDCIVDLYLYDRDGALTVAYVEARSHTAEIAPTSRCLKSLLERPTAQNG